jgi:hypothetical protein
MKVMHHVFSNWESSEVQIMAEFGFVVAEGTMAIQIEENEKYFKIKPYLDKWEVVNMVYPEFTDEELNMAKWLIFGGNWDNGYPQPESDGTYLDHTYDLSDYCKNCGCGGTQKAPFRIKSEPKWGKNKIFQLFWIGDEIFSEINFYNDFFAPLGIGSRAVLIHKTGKEAENTVQLELPMFNEDLDVSNFPFETCPVCSRKKYKALIPDFIHKYHSEPPFPIFKGKEYFGSGGMGFKRMFVSQDVRQGLLKNKTSKPKQFIPLR